MNLIKDNFADWKKIAAERHNKYNNLLNTYWIYCEQYLNQTYDLNEFEILNNSRKLFIYSSYTILVQDYSIRQIAFSMMNASALANIEGDCPQTPPKLNAPQKEMKINVPKKKGPPCPFKDSKLKLGLGACSAGLDCENIEAECGEGVIGAVKWNYKKKEMTLFVGVGAKANLGFVPGKGKGIKELNEGLGGEAEIKGGYQITVNKQGQVIDHGFSGEVGAKANIGGLSAGATYGVTATAETGINGEFTKEFTATVFK